jgi:hypothetical protein
MKWASVVKNVGRGFLTTDLAVTMTPHERAKTQRLLDSVTGKLGLMRLWLSERLGREVAVSLTVTLNPLQWQESLEPPPASLQTMETPKDAGQPSSS